MHAYFIHISQGSVVMHLQCASSKILKIGH